MTHPIGNGTSPDRGQSTSRQDDPASLRIRVYGSRKRLLPDGDTATVPFIPGETIKKLLLRLNIPDEEVWLIVVNGTLVDENFIPSPGDQVDVMSPVAGG